MSLTTLLLSILCLLATLGVGASVIKIVCRAHLPVTLQIGASYGVGAALIGSVLPWISAGGISLEAASWLLIVASFMVALATFSSLGVRKSEPAIDKVKVFNERSLSASPLNNRQWNALCWLLVSLTTIHIGMSIFGNSKFPIFFWDAFTSWIYKAKAWSLQGAITPIVSPSVWLENGGLGFYSAKGHSYSDTLSSYAVFLSAIGGGWHWPSVSLSWSYAYIAICSAIFGITKLAGNRSELAAVAAFLISSLPLLNVHAAFAGYADIWMALLSGTGLALLLVWRSANSSDAFSLGVLMLISGAMLKNEGTLWLFLGFAFAVWEVSRARFGLLATGLLTLLPAIAIYSLGFREVDIPILGFFGVTDTGISAGLMGNYGIRPIDSAQIFVDALFNQSNFLLLPVVFVASLAAMTLQKPSESLPIHTLNILLIGSFLIIFGVSSYSRFAEAGTVVNRVLLQITPAIVTAVMVAWSSLYKGSIEQIEHRLLSGFPITKIWPAVLIGLSLLLILLVIIVSGRLLSNLPDTEVRGDQLVPVAGSVEYDGTGVKFKHSSIDVGVLRLPSALAHGATPPYLLYDISFADEGDVSFYWVREGDADVQSYSLTQSGEYILHLGAIKAWEGPIKEAGLIIQPDAFEETWVRRVLLKNKVSLEDWRPIAKAWTTPASVTQLTANQTVGHIAAPVNLILCANWLIAVLIALGLSMARLFWPKTGLIAISLSVLAIWATTDLLLLSNSEITAAVQQKNRPPPTVSQGHTDQWGGYLPAIAENVIAELPAGAPIIFVPTSEATHFAAQKLPYHLLPNRAISLKARQGKKIPKQWPGGVVILGTPSEPPEALASKISQASDMRIISDFGHYQILYGNGAD